MYIGKAYRRAGLMPGGSHVTFGLRCHLVLKAWLVALYDPI